jgi:hypothetical protein
MLRREARYEFPSQRLNAFGPSSIRVREGLIL